MKILVVTYNALMTSTPNGRTMLSLLEGFAPNEIANFCVTGTPDAQYCANAYKVTNKDAARSFLLSREYGGVTEPQNAKTTDDVLFSDVYHGKKSPWKYYLREKIWKRGMWKGERLKTWLIEQKFDCILYMYGDGAALQNFSVDVSEFLHIPLFVYSCEEYCFKDYNYINRKENSCYFKKYQELSRTATARLFSAACALICNTDQLGRLYREQYGIADIHTIMMASDMEFVENVSVPAVEDMTIAYCGSIGRSRRQALIDIANALHAIDPCLKLDIYGRADEETAALLREHEAIHFHGFISYEEVQNVIRRSTLQVQTITFDDYYAKNRRFGFSTKNADCLACGTPYLLYERAEIVEIQFMQEHDCAFAVTDREMLVPLIKEALFNEEERRRKVNNARNVTRQYFSKERNIEIIHTLFKKYYH